MLRNVFPGGTESNAETNNKLLELADRDANDDAVTSGAETEEEAEPEASAIASVITQVSAADARPGPSARADDIDGRTTWKSKFR